MKVTVEKKKGLNKDLKIFIDKETMNSYMDEKYEEIKGSVNLKGFRPGKVPKEILKRQFGKAVFGEVLDKVLKETSTKALEEKKIWKNEDTSNEWKETNLKDIQERMSGWQLESFKESYDHKKNKGISLFKKSTLK